MKIDLLQILPLLFTSCVVLDKLRDLAGPRFPYLRTRAIGRINTIKHIQGPAKDRTE